MFLPISIIAAAERADTHQVMSALETRVDFSALIRDATAALYDETVSAEERIKWAQLTIRKLLSRHSFYGERFIFDPIFLSKVGRPPGMERRSKKSASGEAISADMAVLPRTRFGRDLSGEAKDEDGISGNTGISEIPVQPSRLPSARNLLSPREAAVLELIGHGLSNKRIARSLGIAPETVKSHAKHILGKLNAQTRAEAVALAAELNLI